MPDIGLVIEPTIIYPGHHRHYLPEISYPVAKGDEEDGKQGPKYPHVRLNRLVICIKISLPWDSSTTEGDI